jgi:hypothetical protein
MQEFLGFVALIIVIILYVKFRIWWKSLPYKKAMRDYEREKQQEKH